MSKLKEAKSAYFSRLNLRNYKSFWQAIKYINIKESSILTLKDDSSFMVTISSSDKANIINSFFARCFNHALPPLSPESHSNTKIIDSELLHDFRGVGRVLKVDRLWVCHWVEPIIIRLMGDKSMQWVLVK